MCVCVCVCVRAYICVSERSVLLKSCNIGCPGLMQRHIPRNLCFSSESGEGNLLLGTVFSGLRLI